MSTITGSCGVSEAQLLFERGIQEQQSLRAQQNPALDAATVGSPNGPASQLAAAISESQRAAEPNKGQSIDVYV